MLTEVPLDMVLGQQVWGDGTGRTRSLSPPEQMEREWQVATTGVKISPRVPQDLLRKNAGCAPSLSQGAHGHR